MIAGVVSAVAAVGALLQAREARTKIEVLQQQFLQLNTLVNQGSIVQGFRFAGAAGGSGVTARRSSQKRFGRRHPY
jgi:hypothetical protein